MPINQWLSPYTMETSAKTSSSNPTATFWASSASPAAVSVFGFNLNNEDEEEMLEEAAAMDVGDPKQPLFEKPLTPSDVGKLNRLVIPKQHAEKYFPLNGGVSVEKGLLLGFEDEVGKSWRFRYSYWNSSQSYVLTKGWSRFVKEKRLDAGDIVVFARHPKEVGRLFIGWRRRSAAGGQGGGVTQPPLHGGGWSDVFYSGQPYPSHHQTDCLHAENHVRGRNKNSKILRLFGVNLECEGDDSESSTTKPSSRTHQLHHDDPYRGHYLSNNRTGHTDFEVWRGDVHQHQDLGDATSAN